MGTFTENYTFAETRLAVLMHGNQTFGFGADAQTVAPITVNAGVTLTIKSGVTVLLISDSPDINAIVGTDVTSTIVVEDGARVLSDDGSQWATGTYTWNTNTWVRQP